MSNDFEKLMNEKMDNASLNDVMPDFDKAATWNELESRIPTKKTKPLFAWWTHAAAIVAGIVLGGFALQILFNQDKNNAAPATVVQVEKQPAEVIVKTDTVFITKEVMTEPVVQPIRKASTPQPKVEEVIVQEEAKQPLETKKPLPVIEEEIIPETKEVIAKAKKVKPIHLLDIDNENRQDALYNSDPENWKRSGFALTISTKRLPDNRTQSQPPILNGIFKKK